jgi:DNA-binding Lrp family transcriptional regulator
VGLSQAAARARVVRLLDAGVIHVTALIEASAVGVTERLGFGLRCRGDASALADNLASLPGISFAATGFGSYDIVGGVTATDRRTIVDTLETIRRAPEVSYTETWDYLAVAKERQRIDGHSYTTIPHPRGG